MFQTPWMRADDSWGQAARVYARAMHQGGLDVRLVSWNETLRELTPAVAEEVRDLVAPVTEYDLLVFSSILSCADNMRGMLGHLAVTEGKKAFHCVFERLRLEPELGARLNRSVTGCWAQCSANRDALLAAGVERVAYIPFPYFGTEPHLQIPATERPPRHFLSITRFEPRKAPDRLLRAFLHAFKPGEAELTMKFSLYAFPGEFTTPEAVILDALAEPQVRSNGWDVRNWREGIRFIRERLSEEQMLALHAWSDVYVSTSRGEGLDMPAFAAKLAGRRLVLTDSGGPRDFVTENDIVVPATGEVAAHPAYLWGPDGVYADHDFDQIVAALSLARRLGAPRTPERIPSSFHIDVVSKKFRAWVEDLCSQ